MSTASWVKRSAALVTLVAGASYMIYKARTRRRGVTEPFIFIPSEGRLDDKEVEAVIENVIQAQSYPLATERSQLLAGYGTNNTNGGRPAGIGEDGKSDNVFVRLASDIYRGSAAIFSIVTRGAASTSSDEDDGMDDMMSVQSSTRFPRRHSNASQIKIHEPDVPRLLQALLNVARHRAVTVLRRLLGSVGETDERVLSRSTKDVEDDVSAQLHGPAFAAICDKFVKALPWRDGTVRVQDFVRTFESAIQGPLRRSPHGEGGSFPFAW